MMSPVVTCQIVQWQTNPIAHHSFQRTPAKGQTAAEDKLESPERLHWTFALFCDYNCDWLACSERSSYICQLLVAIQWSKPVAWTLASWYFITKMAKQAMLMHIFVSSTIYIGISSSLLRYGIAGLAVHRQTISYLHTAIDECCLPDDRN